MTEQQPPVTAGDTTEPTPATAADPDHPSAVPAAGEPLPAATVRALAIVGFLVVLAIQIVLLVIVVGTRSEVADLRAEIQAGGGIPSLGSGQASAGPASPTPPAATTPQIATGTLPRFVAGGTDTALGLSVGDVAGVEYYTGENAVFRTTDGKARAFMVWAHWCPFCQEELPVMAEWQGRNAGQYEGFELVSVTTAMDDNAANPLLPYLDNNQFPFPVLFDGDGRLARQLGASAFPFWVFVAPDGTVVGRAAGGIDPANLASIFEQLNELAVNDAGALAP